MKHRSPRFVRRWSIFAAAVTISTVIATAGAASASSARLSQQTPLTVTVVSQTWPTLDPLLDTGISTDELISIYGQLFERASNNSIVPSLASGYSFSNFNKTLTITVRKGVEFSDGTPLNAAVVLWNLQRDFNPANACGCLTDFGIVSSVTASGNNVILQLAQPDAPILQAFVAQAPNLMVDPTAFTSMGVTAFGQHPVGAGLYQVVSNVPSSQLVLKANPNYWQKGHPIIQSLTFIDVGSDQSAYASLESGQAQMVLGISTPSILTEARGQFQVVETKGSESYQINFDTKVAPFNNVLARKAVAYATNATQLLDIASPGYGSTTEAPIGNGALYTAKKVQGYIRYDLTKAKQLVQQIGGLSVDLGYGTNIATYVIGAQAFQNELEQAGINVTLAPTVPNLAKQIYATNSWQVNFAATGAVDPDNGSGGFPVRFSTHGEFSGVADPKLDTLIERSEVLVSPASRAQAFAAIYKYIVDNVYSVPLFDQPTVVLASKSLEDIDVAANFTPGKDLVQWENLRFKS